MAEVLFYVIIFLANIIQGITGFAGTILAMPFSIHLVGYAVAKPVLNVLGIIAGIYVVAGGYQKVNTKELKRVCLYMGIGIVAGIFLKQAFAGHERLLYVTLGIFVIGIGLRGLLSLVNTHGRIALESWIRILRKQRKVQKKGNMVSKKG